MRYALGLTVAGALIFAAQIDRPAAQTNSQPIAREPLKLSEQDKQAVIAAATEADTHQNTPKEFTPAVGALVPKEVYLHGFKPEIASKVSTLKHYWYAHLDREILLIDAMQSKVVALIPLPEKLESVGQGHQGAAEPATSKDKYGAGSTESVPSHTSPETIR
ncbi:MAG: hypothetical protein ACRECO_13650 [Xanthobacteraceae bacterium]